MQDIPTNPIAKIADPVKRKQVFEIGVCSQTKVYDDLMNATAYITNREYVKI